jgi:putative inorganic carbon (hco3(-)) transporter
MSVTAMVWAALAVCLCAGAVIRPAWSLALYMLTFFAAPPLWWWGRDLPSIRYALISGFILLASVVLHSSTAGEGRRSSLSLTSIAALAMVVNATFVHFGLASTPEISFEGWVELLKFVLLFFLMVSAIQNRNDLQLVLVSLALGGAYIGYEVTINDRGDFRAGRLEQVGAPGADTANALASMLLLVLPLIGSLFIDGKRWQKLLVILSAPLVLNVVILCNSRGAFLGLIGGGLTFLLLARGPTRKKAAKVLMLGAAALYLLLGDPKILDRFTTTFVGAEERDRSAASRIEFWQAGMVMLLDYPLGDGGGAFKYVHANKYLAAVGSDQTARSLHNGYLTDATDWGLQGLALKLLFIGSALVMAYRTVERCRAAGRLEDALVGVSFIVGGVSFLIICMFGSYLASEWAFWLAAFLVRYAQLYAEPAVRADGVPAKRSEAVNGPRLGEAVA